MKTTSKLILFISLSGLLFAAPAAAAKLSKDELIQELEAMKKRVQQLEAQLQGTAPEHEKEPATGQGLPERIRKIEEQVETKSLFEKWTEKIILSGLIEAEAVYENMDFADPAIQDEDSSDILLATVELGIDVDITKHVSGHVLFLWEEDDTEPVDMDEGFMSIDGEDVVPLYLDAGKMYVPFGCYETHFISDPLTLELGETRESAVRIGFTNEMFDLSAAAFNGDVDEIGENNQVDSFVASLSFSLPEESALDFDLAAGASYISNIADSDGLEGETPGEIADCVSGFGAYLSLTFRDRWFLEFEYVGALDPFQPGELSFDGGHSLKPRAWNIEFAVAPVEDLELALRYEGSEDLADFQPEQQYGAAMTYNLFACTALSLEYLHGEFQTDDERERFTVQLAFEF